MHPMGQIAGPPWPGHFLQIHSSPSCICHIESSSSPPSETFALGGGRFFVFLICVNRDSLISVAYGARYLTCKISYFPYESRMYVRAQEPDPLQSRILLGEVVEIYMTKVMDSRRRPYLYYFLFLLLRNTKSTGSAQCVQGNSGIIRSFYDGRTGHLIPPLACRKKGFKWRPRERRLQRAGIETQYYGAREMYLM